MEDEVRDRFEVPKEMRSMAQASFDQARKAFEKLVTTARQTAGSIEERRETVRAGAKDFNAKAIEYYSGRGPIRMFFERGGRIFSTDFSIR